MRRLWTMILALLALSLPGYAWAQESDSVRQLLLSHDVAPTPRALAAAADDPVATLQTMVHDEAELGLVRRRATLMLGRFDDQRVEPFLANLLRSSPEGSLRRAAAVALSHHLTASSPERLVSYFESMLGHQDALDRETAVWLLGRLQGQRALEVLSEHRIVERHRSVVDALRRVLAAHQRNNQ